MADSSLTIRLFTRDEWTLGDLRELVDEVEGWDDSTRVDVVANSIKVIGEI